MSAQEHLAKKLALRHQCSESKQVSQSAQTRCHATLQGGKRGVPMSPASRGLGSYCHLSSLPDLSFAAKHGMVVVGAMASSQSRPEESTVSFYSIARVECSRKWASRVKVLLPNSSLRCCGVVWQMVRLTILSVIRTWSKPAGQRRRNSMSEPPLASQHAKLIAQVSSSNKLASHVALLYPGDSVSKERVRRPQNIQIPQTVSFQSSR